MAYLSIKQDFPKRNKLNANKQKIINNWVVCLSVCFTGTKFTNLSVNFIDEGDRALLSNRVI